MAENDQPDTSQDDVQGTTQPQQNDDEQQNDTDTSNRSDRAGQSLDREGLEKALRKARDENAKLRSRAREFSDDETYRRATEALSELQKAEDAKKSVEERLTERSEQLLWRASESEKQVMRLRAALNAGIGAERVDEFASRLRGDTEEELAADAEQLRVLFAPVKPERRADPSQGAGRVETPSVHPLQAALENLGLSR